MTHYKYQSEKSTFVATYKRGALCKVEHKRGSNTPQQWRGFILTVPFHEKDIESFSEKWKKVYVSEFKPGKKKQAPKTDSQYKHYVSDWFLFYHQVNQVEPKFTATDGKAIKAIMKHFESISDSPEDARASWQAILVNWKTLPDFYRRKTDLVFINAKLNEIITHLKDTDNGRQQANTFREKI